MSLSELALTMGEITASAAYGRQGVEFADRSEDTFRRVDARTVLADALHQAGDAQGAEALFREAEVLFDGLWKGESFLVGIWGFRFCDLLLDLGAVQSVKERVQETIKHARKTHNLLDIALDYLSLSRADFREAQVEECVVHMSHGLRIRAETARYLNEAVQGLRKTGDQQFIACGLLSRAWLRFLDGDANGARADLDEAWDIAERGPMKLFLADIHLHRTRLFFREKPYPWKSPQSDLAAAEKLISECGYHRRDEELADAKRAILGV